MDLPNPRVELASLTSPALAVRYFTTGITWEALVSLSYKVIKLRDSLEGSDLLTTQRMKLHKGWMLEDRTLKITFGSGHDDM